MPGRDITRLRNRAARVLFLLTFVIWTAVQIPLSACAQSAPAPPQTQAQPDQKPDKHPVTNAPSVDDKKLNDQGVFVFKKDVDEVLLHASVIDDNQHIVTNLYCFFFSSRRRHT